MVWAGRDYKDHLDHPALLPWAGWPPNRPGCSKLHPMWPRSPPGMGHPQFHWATCASASPYPHLFTMVNNFFWRSNLNQPSFSFKPLPFVLSLHYTSAIVLLRNCRGWTSYEQQIWCSLVQTYVLVHLLSKSKLATPYSLNIQGREIGIVLFTLKCLSSPDTPYLL